MTLFGINIADIVTGALEDNLTSVTITRTTKGEFTPGTGEHGDDTVETFTTEGINPAFSSMGGRAKMIDSGLLTSQEVPLLLLASPLGTDPLPGDKIKIGGDSYTITGIIEKDPANSTWTVRAKK